MSLLLIILAFAVYYFTKSMTRNSWTAILAGVGSILILPIVFDQLKS